MTHFHSQTHYILMILYIAMVRCKRCIANVNSLKQENQIVLLKRNRKRRNQFIAFSLLFSKIYVYRILYSNGLFVGMWNASKFWKECLNAYVTYEHKSKGETYDNDTFSNGIFRVKKVKKLVVDLTVCLLM